MRILIPGGSGQLGNILARHLHKQGHAVTVLSRTPTPAPWHTQHWDGLTLDPAWTHLLEDADAVIHLSGRSVNCRYTPENRKQIIDSRILPTLTLGEAITRCTTPPKLWMNASTSTFYSDTRAQTQARPNDEFTGELGGLNPSLPSSWKFSIDVARRWEQAFHAHTTPRTRKIALRTSMTMSPDPGGVFSVFANLIRFGLGGTQGPGDQYVSWMHDQDYCRAIDFLLTHENISGPVNFTAPVPLLNRDFMRDLRSAFGMPVGLPAASWMLEIGSILLRTETELILKSRRAIPTVLQQNGFHFDFPTWPEAAHNLVTRYELLKDRDDG